MSPDDLYDDIKQPLISGASEKGYVNGAAVNTDEPQSYVKIQTNQALPAVDGMAESYEVMATAERFICSSELHNQQEVLQHQASPDMDPGDSWCLIGDDEVPPLLEAVDGKVDSSDIQTVCVVLFDSQNRIL